VSDLPTISILGPGNVGTALGALAGRSGYRVLAVGGRNEDRARQAAQRIGPDVRATGLDDAARAGELVLLTVPDDAIAPLARRLAEQGAFRDRAIVAHCSGALDSEVLAPARDRRRCALGSLHPLTTFPTVESALDAMPQADVFVEGDARALAALSELGRRVGRSAQPIDREGKVFYHAAAVLACNDAVALLSAAIAAAGHAGIAPARALEALRPLVEATIRNVFQLGPDEALTGPVARGDAGTVARHLHALDARDPRVAALYRAAGNQALVIASRRGSLDAEARDRVATALQDSPGSERA
jgi:predicted short-subunit dehydrogenase-like oxidoreductase (DUF2520 family)